MKADELKEQRPLRTLFSDLVRETTDLVRKEIALATSEMSQKATRVKSGVSYLAVGGALLFAALLFMLNSAVAWLAILLPNAPVWAPSLVVAGVVAVIGFIVLLMGRSSLEAKNLVPHRTVDSLRRDTHTLKEPV
jgi:hypothetical protein